MKRLFVSLTLGLSLTLTPPLAAGEVTVAGRAVEAAATVRESTTYVSLRAVVQALAPEAGIQWTGSCALAEGEDFTLTAQPGNCWLEVNGRALYVPQGVLLEEGRTLVPVRVLAQALGAAVDWDSATGEVTVTSGTGEVPTGSEVYDADDLYWLSRIISAESRGEPLEGQIAVGNVVLNRVASADFPNTIYGVIFDSRWGGQFTPVSNGTIYQEPAAQSVEAARLCLSGVNVAGESLYFLAPSLASSHWIMENRTHVVTIGSHWFYK